MILNIVFILIGGFLILWGADALTDGASTIAKKWGVSELVVGLTVVAFGTSCPELVISVISAVEDKAGLAIGNIVGSNLFNVLMIVGIVAMIKPIKVQKSIMVNEIPLVLLASIVLAVMGLSPLLDPGTSATLTRVDGIILLLFFAVFLRYTFATAKREEATQLVPDSASASVITGMGSPMQTSNKDTDPEEAKPEKAMSMKKAILWVILGLAALVGGGEGFVMGASGIATSLGVSDAVIGLTIAALGSSLPELATSISAALKGRNSMVLGNVIGSNIFNIFMILGVSGLIRPLPFGQIGIVDLLTLVGSSLLFWIFGWFFGDKVIGRWEGGTMVLVYAGYMTWLLMNAL